MGVDINETSPELPAAVLHVTTSLNVGGAQAMLRKLVEYGERNRGALQHTIVSLLPPGVMTPDPDRSGCSVYTLGMRRGLPSLTSFLRLVRIANHRRPDVVQGWMYHGNLAASLSARTGSRTLPVIWNVRHSLADPKVERRSTRALLTLSAPLSRGTAAIIYNSQTAAREHEAVGFAPERSVHIPNGFDCQLYRPEPARRALLRGRFGIGDQGILVGMVARYHPMKDHANLIRATAAARQAGHDLHLLLVGTGLDAPPPDLAAAIRTANIPADRLTLIGERGDVADWLPGLDMLALPSAWGEAFPNILGEAMACGVPCIATDVGDSADIIADPDRIVSPRDPVALADALGRLASAGAEVRAGLGDGGRRRVLKHYEIGEIARRYHRLYADVARGGEASEATGSGQPPIVRTARAA